MVCSETFFPQGRPVVLITLRPRMPSSVFRQAGHSGWVCWEVWYMCEIPWWVSGKESACQAGDLGLIPGSGRSPGERKWQPTSVFLPGKSLDRGAWWTTIHGVAKELDMTLATKQQWHGIHTSKDCLTLNFHGELLKTAGKVVTEHWV